MRATCFLLSLTTAAALSLGTAHAAVNLVKNGDFTETTNGGNKQLSAKPTDSKNRTTIKDWTSSNGNDGGYNFVLDGNQAKTWDSAIWLKSQNNGYAASPTGGNLFASDALYHPGTLSQTISGLEQGAYYTLSFDYALAQQVGFKGANSDNYWHVVFGNNVFNTTGLSIANGGFSGWQTANVTFKASNTSQVLSFLAESAAPGAPPFLLLDNVQLAAVPEAETWAMLLAGMGLLGWTARRRARRA